MIPKSFSTLKLATIIALSVLILDWPVGPVSATGQ
jgi:hypothetical protein